MRRCILLVLCGFVGLMAAPAMACRIYMPGADVSVLHREPPQPLPSGLFVAEVAFENPEAGWRELLRGTRARIIRVIQGSYDGDMIIVRDLLNHDEIRLVCYAPVRDGGTGFIIGTPIGFVDDVMVLKPRFEARGRPRPAPQTP